MIMTMKHHCIEHSRQSISCSTESVVRWEQVFTVWWVLVHNLAGPAISLSFLTCGTACIFTSPWPMPNLLLVFPLREVPMSMPTCGIWRILGMACGMVLDTGIWLYSIGSGTIVGRLCGQTFYMGVVQSWTGTEANISLIKYLTQFPIVGNYTCSPLSIVIVALCTWVLVSGAKESSRFNNFMTVLNISVCLVCGLAGVGFGFVESRQFRVPMHQTDGRSCTRCRFGLFCLYWL